MASYSDHPAGGSPRVFLSAGEISGDFQASHLARAILEQSPDAQLYGCGGERMRAAGVDVRLQTAQLGYVGLQESLRFQRPIRAAQRQIESLLRNEPPDLAVLVDGERFNDFLTGFLHREGIPFIYYFVPQVWFWGRWRTRRIARRASLVIPAFPAELEIFRRKGAHTEWLGHPLLDIVRPAADGDSVLTELGLNPSRPMIALMPGSRWQEIENFAPVLFDAARQLKQRRPELQFVLPLAARHLLTRLKQLVGAAGLANEIQIISEHVYTCLSRCELVMLSSGTATLETALLGVPMIAFYRVHPATYLAAKALVKTRFIAMPNILLGDAVVPELIQSRFTSGRLFAEATSLLENPARAEAMRRKLAEIPALLGGRGVLDRAARVVLREAAARRSVAAARPIACEPSLV